MTPVPAPPHVLRLVRALIGLAPTWTLPQAWALSPARPTAEVAMVVAEAFVGAVDFVGDEYEGVLALGADGGEFCAEASLLLTIGDQVVAVCLVQLFDGVPEVSYLCTSPGLRRRGAARLLLSASLSALQEAGHGEAVLFVHRESTAARALYASLGFAATPQGPHPVAPTTQR